MKASPERFLEEVAVDALGGKADGAGRRCVELLDVLGQGLDGGAFEVFVEHLHVRKGHWASLFACGQALDGFQALCLGATEVALRRFVLATAIWSAATIGAGALQDVVTMGYCETRVSSASLKSASSPGRERLKTFWPWAS